MSERKYVCGRECTITILQDNTYTAIPFVSETIRCVPHRFDLQDTLQNSTHVAQENGYDITGTITTLLTENTITSLFALLATAKSFDVLVKRGTSKVIYKNVLVQGFELRGRLDEHVYLKLDIGSTKKSYATKWEADTIDVPWERETVFSMRRKNFVSDYCSLDVEGVYYFVFSGDFAGTRTFNLTIHFPLPRNTVIGKTHIETDTVEHIALTLHKVLRINFEQLRIEHDMFDVQGASELLLVRDFCIEGAITYTFENASAFVEGVL